MAKERFSAISSQNRATILTAELRRNLELAFEDSCDSDYTAIVVINYYLDRARKLLNKQGLGAIAEEAIERNYIYQYRNHLSTGATAQQPDIGGFASKMGAPYNDLFKMVIGAQTMVIMKYRHHL